MFPRTSSPPFQKLRTLALLMNNLEEQTCRRRGYSTFDTIVTETSGEIKGEALSGTLSNARCVTGKQTNDSDTAAEEAALVKVTLLSRLYGS